MPVKNILQNLCSLEELNILDDIENIVKITKFQIDPINYGLLTYGVGTSRISFIKLTLNELFCTNNSKLKPFDISNYDSDIEKEAFKICLLNIFCLPFTLLTVICTRKNVWVIGEEAILDLKPFIEQALQNAKLVKNDDNMDVEDVEEFHPHMFDFVIPVHQFKKYNLHLEDIFIGCNFIDYAVIWCHTNSKLCTWSLELLFANYKSQSSDEMKFSFLDFPISFNESRKNVSSNEEINKTPKPLIICVHYDDPESHMLQNLFGINCSSPNVVCFIGHPEGKLLLAFCDSNSQFQSSQKLQTLFDIKQPFVGIFFLKDIEAFQDCDCMLIVGVLGQLTLISSKKYSSFSLQSGCHSFWTKTFYLKSSISYCDVVENCLLYFSSDGTLWTANISELFNPNQPNKELATASSEFYCIEQMIIADKNQGLIILKTQSGNIYLTRLNEELDSEADTSSLPSLMNECLNQSNEMQELLNKKVLQSRLFAAVCTFASLKYFENSLKEPISFSISEVNLEPRKYVLVINLKCLENMHLDSELCQVTATVFTYFKDSNTAITKTTIYDADEPTLCLELTDTVLQPSFVSMFPLFVEVGLILQLPDGWKTIDCFKTVSSFLPFYLRIQTFLVHELNLLQSGAICLPQSLKLEIPKTLKIIKELGMKRPISNILQIEPKKDHYHLPRKFHLCLSASSVEEMMKNTSDSDPCKYIENLLFGNAQANSALKESYVRSKGSPISINVSKNNNHIVIMLTANSFNSLIGLRIAVLDSLLAAHRKSKPLTNSSMYVNIPASIYKKCEAISKSLIALYGQDVESDEVIQRIVQLYQELRTDVSGKLPIL